MKKAKSPINVLEHVLVPVVKVVPEGQKSSILEKYGLSSPLQLPQMKKGDPVAVALGAKGGDIIKIERDEPTGKCVHYRLVIS